MAETLSDFIRENAPDSFAPIPFYSKDGDFVSFFFESADHYGDRIDDFLTLYRTLEGDRLVGCKCKGISHILKKLGDFGVVITDGPVKLSILFLAYASELPPERQEPYRQVAKQAEGVQLTFDHVGLGG